MFGLTGSVTVALTEDKSMTSVDVFGSTLQCRCFINNADTIASEQNGIYLQIMKKKATQKSIFASYRKTVTHTIK
jgi:hypothetical protein